MCLDNRPTVGAHRRANCPFRDATCFKCSLKGHIAKVCRSKDKVDYLSADNTIDNTIDIDKPAIQSITSLNNYRRIYIPTSLLDQHVQFQYDSGSDITTIGKDTWIRLGSPTLSSGKSVEHAGGNALKTLGRFKCKIRAANREGDVVIDVAARDGLNLFGLNAIDKLNLWAMPLDKCREFCENSQRAVVKHNKTNSPVESPPSPPASNDHIVKNFPKLFSKDLGQCKNFRAKLTLSENSVPVQIPCRQIPFAMETLLDEELQHLKSLDIIERVHQSDWSTPIVIVKKPNGKIRLCADYFIGVNKALKNNMYPLPNIDSIVSKLNGNSYFSVLDLSDAFLQIEIAERYRDVTTIATPKGLFRYKRLPFGIKMAPATFQQAMDQSISGLDGVGAYIDDIYIAGFTRQEHEYVFAQLYNASRLWDGS